MNREWNQDRNESYQTNLRNSLSRRISDQTSESKNFNRIPKISIERRVGDRAYDTDEGTHRRRTQQTRSTNNPTVDPLVSPRLTVRRTNLSPMNSSTSLQPRLSIRTRSHYDERDEDSSTNDETRQKLRNSRRLPPTGHLALKTTRFSSFSTAPGPPLRLIFMRHAERMNQALGVDWFHRAYATNSYRRFDRNMPVVLPKRRYEHHFEYDVPLTVRGLETAHLTGRALKAHNHLPSVCLSSTSLRCVQTTERLLSGMDVRHHIPIRIEPAIFECPHQNPKLVESFMSPEEFSEISYNIKKDYKPILNRINVPETLEEYFDRSAFAMRRILDRYGQAGETVLIVTHAPGLLALTEALKGQRPNPETFYRTVAMYPPLALFIAEYDGIKWKYSEQPYNIVAVQ